MKIFSSVSIENKILIFLTFFTFAPLYIFSIISINESYYYFQENGKARGNNILQLLEFNLNDYLEMANKTLEELAKERYTPSDLKKNKTVLSKFLNQTNVFYKIELKNPHNKTILAVLNPRRITNKAENASNAFAEIPNYRITRPIWNDKKRTRKLFTLVGWIDFSTISTHFRKFRYAKNENLFLLDETGRLKFKGGSYPLNSAQEFETSIIAKKIAQGEEGSMIFPFQGTPVFSIYQPLKSLGWGIAIQQPVSELYKRHKLFTYSFAYLLGVITLFLPVISLVISRRLTRSMKKLVYVTNEIASGNYSFPLTIDSKDEIGELASNFSIMQKAIAQKVNKLEELQSYQGMMIEDERSRIAKDLHDDLLQQSGLISSTLPSQGSVSDICRDGNCWLDNNLPMIKSLLKEWQQIIRRIVNNVGAQVLRNLGLLAGISDYIQTFNERFEQNIVLHNHEDIGRWPKDVELAFFRIAQEALTNAVKHAKATEIAIFIGKRDKQLWMHIEDNGIGFDSNEINIAKHFGLINMKERAKQINAICKIISDPGKGTSIFVELL